MIFDSFDHDDTATATRGKFTLTARIVADDDHGAPWDECDGHGPVSDWTSRDKLPGEIVLNDDRASKRFYDMQEACRIARRDQWGSLHPYKLELTRQRGGAWIATAKASRYGKGSDASDIISKPRRDINRAIREVYAAHRATFPSARAYAANAARADYEYLRAWCNDDWHYVGVIVTASRNGIELGEASLWGIESSDSSYLLETANELADEALTDARAAIAALTE